MTPGVLRAVIADDEPLALKKLGQLVQGHSSLQLVGTGRDGESAWSLISEAIPDVAFLDIEMPSISGLVIARRCAKLARQPRIVFTTAFDRYAVTAFELAAIDYLLKPFGKERFDLTVNRLIEHEAAGSSVLADQVDQLERTTTRLTLDSRLYARKRGLLVPIRVNEILRLEGQDDYVLARTAGQSLLLGVRLADLEHQLPTPPFYRIHRSHIVNLDRVAHLAPSGASSGLEVVLDNGESVPVSRVRAKEIRAIAGGRFSGNSGGL